MKIRLWSDIHLEFGPLSLKETDDDKNVRLFVAGDLDTGCRDRAKELMLQASNRFKSVFYTPGNHEYYHNCVQTVDRDWAAFAVELPNFYFLQGDCVIDGDVRVIGGTFWTNFNDEAHLAMRVAGDRMNDYRCIRWNDRPTERLNTDEMRRFRPADAVAINKEQRRKFAEFLDVPFAGKTIIMTHHAPTEHSIDPSYNHHSSDRVLNYAYRNTGLDSWFEEKNFDAWLHGHIHRRQEHVVHGKRIIANPRGYLQYETMAYTFEDDKEFKL